MTPLNTRWYILCLVLFIFGSSSAQINYQKSYDLALKEAILKNRPLLVHVSNPSGSKTSGDFSFLMGSPEVTGLYNNSFVNYKIAAADPDFQKIIDKFGLTSLPACVFLLPGGDLILKSAAQSADPNFYIGLAQEVLARKENGRTLSSLDQKYINGNVDKAFLKEYIGLREKSGIYTNAKLIDNYADFLKPEDFAKQEELVFIYKAGPVVSGKVFGKMGAGHKVPETIVNQLSRFERSAIRDRVIANTVKEAIETKNFDMLNLLDDFILSICKNDPKSFHIESTKAKLAFYKGTNDSTSYYKTGMGFYEQNFMSATVDSIKKSGIQEQEVLHIAEVLNEAANNFYTFGTKNPACLTRALLWSKRSVDLAANPMYFDTMARLFYQLGFQEEAVMNENKAIELLAQQNIPASSQLKKLTEDVRKMKERTL